MKNLENNLHEIGKKAFQILEEKGYKIDDIDKEFEKTIKKLDKKKYAIQKGVWELNKKRNKLKLGKCVYLRQSNFPFKLFILQEVYIEGETEPEVRIGYYIVAPKKLKEEGKIRIVWGQYNPIIPKKDFKVLIDKAKENGIL